MYLYSTSMGLESRKSITRNLLNNGSRADLNTQHGYLFFIRSRNIMHNEIVCDVYMDPHLSRLHIYGNSVWSACGWRFLDMWGSTVLEIGHVETLPQIAFDWKAKGCRSYYFELPNGLKIWNTIQLIFTYLEYSLIWMLIWEPIHFS